LYFLNQFWLPHRHRFFILFCFWCSCCYDA
jgi:hypothetical protein